VKQLLAVFALMGKVHYTGWWSEKHTILAHLGRASGISQWSEVCSRWPAVPNALRCPVRRGDSSHSC